MRRAVGIAWAAGAASILFSACEGGGYYDDRYGYAGYGYCEQATSCGTCTPLHGCGWCSYGGGQGKCFSQPNACRVEQFTWTWEPTGCAALSDGGGPTGDARADASTDRAPAADDAPTPDDATPEGSSNDADPDDDARSPTGDAPTGDGSTVD